MTWVAETLYDEQGFEQRLLVTRELHREKTDFQEIVVAETKGFGRTLFLDGVVQTTERDEFVYHEMITHVPMLAHGDANRVLIIGGGDGGVLREVLRHPVEKAVMVEIDGRVVEECRKFLPSLSDGAFDDPRAELIIADGIKYVAESSDSFDAIIVDSTDPMGPGEVLFTEAFYADCCRLLGDGGVLVTQCGVPFFQSSEVTDSYRRLRPYFSDVGFYLAVVPTYVGGHMTLGWASNAAGLRQVSVDVLSKRFAAAGLQCRYYSPAMHSAAFTLPPFITSLIPEQLDDR
ncbi:MAG: polyamine aminopropyltransferase [Rhodospirillales bacterium]|nr:polyamine aminopropyltransferase [Rhodospirillales bacterium]